jgi:hypothetical protein
MYHGLHEQTAHCCKYCPACMLYCGCVPTPCLFVIFGDGPLTTPLPVCCCFAQDLNGRLWWVSTTGPDWISCAYRAADGSPIYYEGYVQVKWETSPACPETPTMVNSVADANNRLWSWIEGQDGSGENCKFVKADGAAVMKAEVYTV